MVNESDRGEMTLIGEVLKVKFHPIFALYMPSLAVLILYLAFIL